MRVAIDARPALDARKTGVGYYAHHLIGALPQADPQTRYIAWYLHAKGVVRPQRFFADVDAPNLEEKATPFPARVFEPIASRLGIPKLEWFCDFDLLFATNFLPPATGSRGVVLMVHDLAFQLFPETAPQADDRWRRRFRRWLDDAARLIVPSAATRSDLIDLFGVDPSRVDVVHHGVDADAFRPAPDRAVAQARTRFGIDGPYLFFVGGIEPRKNLATLVRAFASLGEGASLVLAGGPVRWFPKATHNLDAQIAALPEGVRSRIVRTGYISDADKLALLTGATAFVYPSRYEGFGMPLLEAMACGVPVLTSEVSSLPEVAGDAAMLVDPDDAEGLAAGMRELLDDGDLANRLSASGLVRAAEFTWMKAAKETAATFRRAGEGIGVV
ncbi:MAG: glycosyltransferase family 1 protein [Actinomycetota bacterium]